MKVTILFLIAIIGQAVSLIRLPLIRSPLKHKKIVNNLESSTLIAIRLGTPPQSLLIRFDTASDLSWIYSTWCAVSNPNCATNHSSYNRYQSSSYQPDSHFNQTINLGTGLATISGDTSFDDLRLSSFAIKNFNFAEVWDASDDVTQEVYDGLIGLSYATIYQTINEASLWPQLKASKLINKNLFSIKMNLNSNSSKFGEVVFGGIDDSLIASAIKKRKFNYVKIIGNDAWRFKVNSVHIGDKLVARKSKLLIATRSEFSFLPNSAIRVINDAIKAFPGCGNQSVIICSHVDSLPDLQIAVGKNRTLTIKSSDYIIKKSDDECGDYCVTGFKAISGDQDWMIGNNLLQAFHTVFDADNHRIGFAQLD